MASDVLSHMPWLGMALCQTTFWLAAGLIVSVIWFRRPARAHLLLVAATAAALVTPGLGWLVRELDWGLVPPVGRRPSSVAMAPGPAPPVRDRHGGWSSPQPDPFRPASVSGGRRSSAAPVAVTGVDEPVVRSSTGRFPFSSARGASPAVTTEVLLWAWALLSGLVAVRLWLSIRGGRQLVTRGRPVESLRFQRILAESVEKLGLARVPELLESPLLCSPVIWCWGRRPVLVMPAASAEASSRLDWSSLFCHELAHWQRRDHWAAALAELMLVILPWHPLAWWVRRRLARFSEQACDDWAVACGQSEVEYADSLLALQSCSPRTAALAVVNGRHSLVARVGRLLTGGRTSPVVGTRWAVSASILMCGAVTLVALAQIRSEATAAQPVVERADEPRDGTTMLVTGRVLNAQGKPVSGAQVGIVARSRRPHAAGNFSADQPSMLGNTRSDERGRFRLAVPRTSSASHRYAFAVAAAEGYGIAWQSIGVDVEKPTAEIRLWTEEPVRGRVVDAEGQPAGGAKVYVTQLGKFAHGECQGIQQLDPAGKQMPIWPQPVVTDHQGRFTIGGVNRSEGVVVQVRDERFARQWLPIEPAVEGQSEEVVLSMKPSQIIEGRVFCEDTKKSLAGARLTIFAGQEEIGSRVGIEGQADDSGRFRMNPFPGKFFWISAYAPSGESYLIRRVELAWPEGAREQRVDIALPRGVLVRGRVSEATSQEPVAGASVQFYPRERQEGIVTGWEGVVVSSQDGVFEIAVPAGEGHLLIHGPTMDYVCEVVDSNMLHGGTSGGRRYYVDALVPVDAEAGSELQDLKVTIRRGAAVNGRLVSAKGEPIRHAIMLWPLGGVSYFSPAFRGRAIEVHEGQFELHGCEPGKTYHVFFLDPKNEVGAAVAVTVTEDGTSVRVHAPVADILSANQTSGSEVVADLEQPSPLTVRLLPRGSAMARFVDSEGDPIPDYEPPLLMVITPGPSRLAASHENSRLFADEAFVSNFDRLNYWDGPTTDQDGRCRFGVLIPGAMYRLMGIEAGERGIGAEFSVGSGDTVELPDVTIDLGRRAQASSPRN